MLCHNLEVIVHCLPSFSILLPVSVEDFSNDDCLLFIAMSHGEEGVLYCKDGTVAVDELVCRLKGVMCPTLVGKPKLFFIQVCIYHHFFHSKVLIYMHGLTFPTGKVDHGFLLKYKYLLYVFLKRY